MSISKLQIYTGKQLRRRFAKYGIVENTRPDWLISTKGERLELDFYLERLGIAVEVQGRQHFEFTPIFHATEWDFQEQLRRDRDKLDVCQRAGIDLLYVCKKSDVEIVLTACYDVLKPSECGVKSDWELRPPRWVAHSSKKCEKTDKLILGWKKKIIKEKKKEQPRSARIANLEALIQKAERRQYL